jgi:hypothetical protein
MYMYMYIYTYTYIYVYEYIHIYIHKLTSIGQLVSVVSAQRDIKGRDLIVVERKDKEARYMYIHI